MSRTISISQSVDPNTMVLEIHEMYRTRVSLLLSRSECVTLCDKLRTLLSDPPTVVIEGPKLTLFPSPKEASFKVRIVPPEGA